MIDVVGFIAALKFASRCSSPIAAGAVDHFAVSTFSKAAQLRHFIDVVEGRAQPLIDAEDARATLAVALQIEEALDFQRNAA